MNKIKVLFVCHAHTTLGGAALSLYNMIEALGDDIQPVVLLQKQGAVSDFLIEKGINCIFFNFLGGLRSKIFTRRLLRGLYEATLYKYKTRQFALSIKKHGFDLIHSNSSAVTFGYELSKLLCIKHIWHIREFLDIDFNFTPIYGWTGLKRAIYDSAASIAITDAVYRHFELNKMKNSHAIWDAVDIQINDAPTMKKDKYFIHIAANLSNAKGTDIAIKSFIKSQLYKHGYSLYLLGKASPQYISYLKHNVISDEADSSIRFYGYCADVSKLLYKATAFLMCSQNEGLGRVTIESMFCGCPVIGFQSAGTAELLKKGNGFLVNNDEECANTMNDIVSRDPHDTIFNAWEFAHKSFSKKEYGRKIIDIYRQIL